MIVASLLWGSPDWYRVAVLLLGAAILALAWGYWRAGCADILTSLAAAFKFLGIALLAICLAEPLWNSTRPVPGANFFAILVDTSESMNIRDPASRESRANLVKRNLAEGAWRDSLEEQFETRKFVFDTHLRSVDEYSSLTFAGRASGLGAALNALQQRFQDLPLAGILLLTDGNTVDGDSAPVDGIPPIYPVVVGSDQAPPDLGISRVSINQSNFDTAPVTIRADVVAQDQSARETTLALLDEAGQVVASERIALGGAGGSFPVRFDLRPKRAGVQFYRLMLTDEEAIASGKLQPVTLEDDATPKNNERLVVVNRAGGPYRVLYVGGRPNWEFKFLRRAIQEDEQMDVIGLVRIAKREPKFSFRSRAGESSNPLFRGFELEDDASEQYDEPVVMWLGNLDGLETAGGFPKTARDLYQFDALIIDEVEASFFTQDQMSLIEGFVSRRGGGLLMLGGPDSFGAGEYERTPIASLLPVYLDGEEPPQQPTRFRLALTREGWLQPWTRLRKSEGEERDRLAAMKPFTALNTVGRIKPAASILAEVLDDRGQTYPALVTHRYGRGQSAAIMIGDLWRWGISSGERDNDLEKAWRQTVRWLVSDVPRRIEVDLRPRPEALHGAIELLVRLYDEDYLPLDNGNVTVALTGPEGKESTIEAEPHDSIPGAYEAMFVPTEVGPYRANVVATTSDGKTLGEREVGWAEEGSMGEFETVEINRPHLERIANRSGGEIVELDDLDRFVATLSSRPAPVVEPWIRPIWHHPLFYLGIMICLTAEWGLRRWRGLA